MTPVTPALLRSWPLPEPDGSKYSRGQVLVVGGARRTPGAAMLAATAALRMGAGRLSLGVAESVAVAMAVAIPESGVIGLTEDARGSVTGEGVAEALAREAERSDAVLVGPGLDDEEGTERLLGELLPLVPDEVPIVLDAFGATVLRDLSHDLLAGVRGRLVLTPNKAELGFLLGASEGDEGIDDELDATMRVAEMFGAAVGCGRWMVHEGQVWEATTGDTGLGTSGSGDVVAGAIAGLLARGAAPDQGLVWGKYVHAAAGDTLAARHGRVGFLASEIGPELPRVMRTLGGD